MKKKLIQTLFLHEWRQLLRQPWQLSSLCLYLVIAMAAMSAGNRIVKARFAQADSIRTAYNADVQAHLEKLKDTASPAGKSAGLAAMVNYRLPQTAIKEPAGEAALSLGLMDIQPWHQQVRYTKNFTGITNIPVSNPVVLFSGNFDLAFVIIYLLPLLVLVFTYSVYAAEQEAGTLALLVIQAGSATRVTGIRLLFRFLLLGSLLTVINLLAFISAERRDAFDPGSAMTWTGICWLYLLFWLAIACVAVAFRRNATITALLITTIWLLLLVIVPSVINAGIRLAYPHPLRDELAAYRRHQSEEIWSLKPAALSDSFSLYNPEYNALRNTRQDTVRLSNRAIAGYYDLLERRMERRLAPVNATEVQKNISADEWMQWNPAMLMAAVMNGISGNDLAGYMEYNRQVDKFQRQWRSFLYKFHLSGQQLVTGDIKKLPAFRYDRTMKETTAYSRAAIYLAVLSLTLIFASAGIARRTNTYR